MNTTSKTQSADACPIINASDFTPEMLRRAVVKRPRGNNATKNPRIYLEDVCAFDIETSRLPGTDDAFMYVWQFQIDERLTVMGRTWDEAMQLFGDIAAWIDSNNVSLVILIHNLSFEFQYLAGVYPFTPAEVFALDSRRVAKCTMFGKKLEFRCTYIHSNMSLAMYTEKMHVQHRKLDGDMFNYKVLRYPWTPLTPEELAYCQNDVLGLVEAYKAEMQRDKDTLSTVPMTSTGYVRRDCKRAMKLYSRAAVKAGQPDERSYAMLRAAFRGGDVHANRYFVGHILHDVKSADRSSSYPDVMCNGRFPISPFRPMRELSMNAVERYISNDRAMLLSLHFTRIRLRDPYYGFPYLPLHKCMLRGSYTIDNGRLLKAEDLTTTVTDIDWSIIQQTYTWDALTVEQAMYSAYAPLPRPLVLTTQEYYKRKTTLKGVPGMEDYYTKSKNMLNSVYGMMVENPIRQTIDFLINDERRFVERGESLESLLERNRLRAWICYQWGVWVTAQARYRLFEGIQLAGENAVYCDTDSVKYIGDCNFSAYNKARIRDSKRSGSYAADPSGTVHYMGVFEQEQTYSRFLTHGAKKYAYEYEDCRTHVTIAGVNKRKGGEELHKAGGLEALKPGFVFTEAGGTESVYNDFSDYSVEIDGHELHITPNICIKDSTYTLTYSADYDKLLSDPFLLRKIKHSFGDFSAD